MSAPNLGIDSEDLNFDIIQAIEKSFGFKFEQSDLAEVSTYGELCAAVQAKLPGALATGCTSQQAFYKLREALRHHLPGSTICPATKLQDVLPAHRMPRRAATAAIEQHLGMKLKLLGMPAIVENAGSLLLALSFFFLVAGGFLSVVGIFALGHTGVLIGLAGFVAAVILLNLGNRFGSNIRRAIVREVVQFMSSTYYRQSRRDPSTVNRREVTDHLNYLFMDMAGLELADLKPDALL